MKAVALVPFKCFTRAKRRLRQRFSDEEVEALGRAMLLDVLAALRGSSVARIVVLTDDAAVAQVASEAGAEVRIEHPDPGLNAAIDAACREIESAAYDASLVVLGDLPLLRTEHVELVLRAGAEYQVVIVPACDGGTAMLLRRPPRCIPGSFGEDSARSHERAAHASGIEPVCLTTIERDVRLDLDTPADAEHLLSVQTSSRTSVLLRRLLQ